MLRPVKKSQEYKGAISQAFNCALEESLLGLPLWLQREGHDMDALKAARFIARQPQELFVRHVHRLLWTAYGSLTSRDVPLTDAWIQQVVSEVGGWSEDEADRAAVTSGLLDELAEKGTCKLTVELGENPLNLVREIVGELSTLYRRRQVIHAVEDLYQKATTWNASTEQAISEAFDAVGKALNQRPASEETAKTLNQLVRADLHDLERQQLGEAPERLVTGFPSIDEVLGGLLPGNLVVYAGRTSMGKTSLVLQTSLNIAKAGHLVVYFTLEMTNSELCRRILSQECRINVLTMRHGDLQEWQLNSVRSRFGDGCQIPIIFDDGNYTPAQIETRLRDFNRMVAPARVAICVVDHLGLMGRRDKTRYDRHDLRLRSYTGELKDLAKRLNLTVLLLSQLNRQSANEQRAPRLSDLRDSGSIEEDADVVLGIYRPFLDTKIEADKPHAELWALKNRSGPCGKVNLTWHPALAMFTDSANAGRCHEDDAAEGNLDHI